MVVISSLLLFYLHVSVSMNFYSPFLPLLCVSVCLSESIKPLCYEVTSVTRAYATATCSNIILAVESKMLLSECMDLSDRAGTSPLDIKELMHLAIEVIVTADFSEADSKSVKVSTKLK